MILVCKTLVHRAFRPILAHPLELILHTIRGKKLTIVTEFRVLVLKHFSL